MQTANETPTTTPEPQEEAAAPRQRRPRFLVRFRARKTENPGQAMVEFAIVSIAFFMIVFGTVDFGRAIYMYSQLHNAVQEGARFGKSQPYDTAGIQNTVINKATSFDLTADDIMVDCRDKNDVSAPCWSCAKVQVEATASFSAITQDFLGISPITLTAVSKVSTE